MLQSKAAAAKTAAWTAAADKTGKDPGTATSMSDNCVLGGALVAEVVADDEEGLLEKSLVGISSCA